VVSVAVALVPYALLATLSPLGFAATLTVMRTGRLAALGFGLGVVLGQALACAALVALGAVARPNRSVAHPTFVRVLELVLGVLLLMLAAIVQRRPETVQRDPPPGRSQAVLDRLGRVHALTAASVGFLLGIGGPKRLVLTALAAATISASGLSNSDHVVLVCWYALLATLLVWLPVLAYLLLGSWAVDRLDAFLGWFGRHRRPATVWTLVAAGLALLADAALLL
jgi:hypothetical protein